MVNPPDVHPKRSVDRATQAGVVRHFSSLDDLVQNLIDRGTIESREELYNVPNPLWGDLFHKWTQQGATGCRFAQHRAQHADEAGWLTVVLPEAVTKSTVDDLESLLTAADDAQAILIVAPHVTNIDDLVRLTEALCEHPSWYCQEVVPADDVRDVDGALIGLRWRLPRSRYESWVLAFGPFDEMPFTRRAPVAALTLRTHPPVKPREDGGVDLAQMPRFRIELDHEEFYWKATSEGKQDLLNGELTHAAKAKVTFRCRRSSVNRLILDRPEEPRT